MYLPDNEPTQISDIGHAKRLEAMSDKLTDAFLASHAELINLMQIISHPIAIIPAEKKP